MIEQLTKVSILKTLEWVDLERLQPYTAVRTYLHNEIIVAENDRLPPRLHALVEGMLEIKKIAANGKESVVRMIPPGEIFAAPALFGNGISPATVVCRVNSQVLTIEREAVLELIRYKPEVAFQILTVFNQRLQQLHQTIHGLISERAIVRLVRLIQYYAAQYGTQPVEEGECLNIHLSYNHIARSIGITYEECLRLVKTMNTALTYKRGGQITIHDWQQLDAIASGEK